MSFTDDIFSALDFAQPSCRFTIKKGRAALLLTDALRDPVTRWNFRSVAAYPFAVELLLYVYASFV